jgi:hypothetical protein
VIPPFDPDGDLLEGVYQAEWAEFQERFCVFARSEQRLKLCQRMARMVEDARASRIVERILFGGSFVSSRAEPNDFDCIIVLKTSMRYEDLQPSQRWIADTREASRRYRGDVFVTRADHPTLAIYMEFFAMNRRGKRVGLVEVML